MLATYPPVNLTNSGSILSSNGVNATWIRPLPQVEINGNLTASGDIILNGISLEERLKTIETVLMIPERDVKLENKYPKLKQLFDEYIAALGKYRTFESIKGEE